MFVLEKIGIDFHHIFYYRKSKFYYFMSFVKKNILVFVDHSWYFFVRNSRVNCPKHIVTWKMQLNYEIIILMTQIRKNLIDMWVLFIRISQIWRTYFHYIKDENSFHIFLWRGNALSPINQSDLWLKRNSSATV
jgi:hypothetical protein